MIAVTATKHICLCVLAANVTCMDKNTQMCQAALVASYTSKVLFLCIAARCSSVMYISDQVMTVSTLFRPLSDLLDTSATHP